MGLIGILLGYALTLFILLLIVRMVLDWTGLVTSTSPGVYRARAVVHRFTEPVLAPVRRVVRPVRAGGVSIDIAFTLVFLAALVLRGIAFSL